LLESIQNTNGLSINASRDSSYNLTNLTALEPSLNLSYDQHNHLSSISDASGRTVSYAYNAKGNLISETDPNGKVTKYGYDSNSRLTSKTLPNKDVLVQNTYDSSGRVISQTNANGFTTSFAYNTPAQGQTTITDPLGNKTLHTYDSSMRITAITDALGDTTSYPRLYHMAEAGTWDSIRKPTTSIGLHQEGIAGTLIVDRSRWRRWPALTSEQRHFWNFKPPKPSCEGQGC
jgi:YD repeat-containing protein